jgi:catecholate siderophore receptor
MFPEIDKLSCLPDYTRADAAVFFSINKRVGLQANVENLFNKKDYFNAENNKIRPVSRFAFVLD